MRLVYDPDQGKENKIVEEHTLSGGTVMEETLDQHAKMKGKPFKEQFAYYFGYYKFHALGVIAVLGVIISIIVTIVTHKDFGFCAMIVNSGNINIDTLQEGFASYAGIDLDEYECYISANETELPSGMSNADVSASTRFAAYLSSGDMDVAIFDSDMFYRKAINGCFMDLRNVFSAEEMAKYEGHFFYIDQVEYEKMQNSNDPTSFMFPDIIIGPHEQQEARLKPYMDPTKMAEPIPVGIVIEDAKGIKDINCYSEMIPVFGIAGNTSRLELAVKFLNFLYDEHVDFSAFRLFNL